MGTIDDTSISTIDLQGPDVDSIFVTLPWCSTRDVDALQLVVGKESQRSAVRRPERMSRSFGARQRLRRRRP
jgi:hypothetical protein